MHGPVRARIGEYRTANCEATGKKKEPTGGDPTGGFCFFAVERGGLSFQWPQNASVVPTNQVLSTVAVKFVAPATPATPGG